jgi:hypothetical protein
VKRIETAPVAALRKSKRCFDLMCPDCADKRAREKRQDEQCNCQLLSSVTTSSLSSSSTTLIYMLVTISIVVYGVIVIVIAFSRRRRRQQTNNLKINGRATIVAYSNDAVTYTEATVNQGTFSQFDSARLESTIMPVHGKLQLQMPQVRICLLLSESVCVATIW